MGCRTEKLINYKITVSQRSFLRWLSCLLKNLLKKVIIIASTFFAESGLLYEWRWSFGYQWQKKDSAG